MAEGRNNPHAGQEENAGAAQAVNTAENTIEQAKQEVAVVPNNGGQVGNGVADSFKGIPMRELIGGPLFAAAEAQEKLASIALDYYNRIAFYGKGETMPGGKTATKGGTRLLTFKVNSPVEENGQMKPFPQTIEAPFIGLVPIPSLLIDSIDVDFKMEVTETNTEKSSTSTEVSSNISAK